MDNDRTKDDYSINGNICQKGVYIMLINKFFKKRKGRTKKQNVTLTFDLTPYQMTRPKNRYSEKECWVTKCEVCGREFLSSRDKALSCLPSQCSGCGNMLIWSIPYTRIEVETDDGIFLTGKNLIHRSRWIDDMRDIVDSAINDESIVSVKVLIKKMTT